MIRRRLIIVVCLAVALAAIGGALTGKWMSPKKQVVRNTPALFVDPSDLDFGEVWLTDRFVHPVTFHNRGDTPIRVTALSNTCSCTAPTSSAVSIPAGQSRKVSLELDLRSDCAAEAPKDNRDFSAPLPVLVEPAESGDAWQLRGRVRTSLTASTRSIDFGGSLTTNSYRPRTVSVHTFNNIDTFEAISDKPYLRVEQARNGDRNWALTVAPFGILPQGRYSCSIELKPNVQGKEPIAPLRLPVEFEILGDVQADTPTVTFGTGSVGEIRVQRVALRSESSRAIRLERWTADPIGTFSASFSMSEKPIFAVDLRCQYRVGEQSGRINLFGTYDDGTPFKVVLDVRAYGLQESGRD